MATSKSIEREAREARDRLRVYNARQAVHENKLSRRKRDNLYAIGGLVAVGVIATAAQLFYFTGGPGTPTPEPTPSATASAAPEQGNIGEIPDAGLAEARTWTGTLGLNDVSLGIELDGALAPQAVASFVTSVNDGYYLDKTCHRLVTGATAGLIQCGSFDGTGASDPTFSFGPIENAGVDGLYPAGTIAMARTSDNGFSQGRQFFIVFQDATLPDDSVGGYTIIGQVTSGLESLVGQIAAAGVADGLSDGTPVTTTVITSLTIQ